MYSKPIYAAENVNIPVTASYTTGLYKVIVEEESQLDLDLYITDSITDVKRLTLYQDDTEKLNHGIDLTTYISAKGMQYDAIEEILETSMPIDKTSEKKVFDLTVTVRQTNNDILHTVPTMPGSMHFYINAPDDFTLASVKTAKLYLLHEQESNEYLIKKLPFTYDETTKKIQFETSDFSTYALIYNQKTPAVEQQTQNVAITQNNTQETSQQIEITSEVIPPAAPIIPTILENVPLVQQIYRQGQTSDTDITSNIILLALALVILFLLIRKYILKKNNHN